MKNFLSLAPLLFVLCTCKNEVKLNAPYKEIPNVYAVFCPQDNIHIVRVNKVFLGEGDANVAAQIADSVNYPAGELTITLDRFVNGVQVDAAPISGKRTITFKDSIVQLNKGAFSSTQRVYVAYEDLHEEKAFIDPDNIKNPYKINTNPNWKVSGTYVLTIKNNHTGNVFKAKSAIVDSIKQTGFPPFVGYYYPTPAGAPPNGDNYIDYSVSNATYTIRYAPNECKLYQMFIRFHFYNEGGGSGRTYQAVDYVFTNQYDYQKTSTSLGDRIVANFIGKDLFSSIGNQLAGMNLDGTIPRKMYMMQFFVYGSTSDYLDYLEFSKPSFNISQSKPLYSNFENSAAYGIFTFRSRSMFFKNMATSFVTEFQRNSNTCRYSFYNADESRHTCP